MTRCNEKRPVCRWSLLLLVAGWFLLALFIGETGLLSFFPGIVIPATVLTLSLGLVAAYAFSSPLRRCLEMLDLRVLIAVHLARFVGFEFLVLASEDRLPREFAVPAGWGDIVIATGALALIAIPRATKSKWPLLVWNTAGLIDILFVVKTAAAIVISQRHSMSVMTHLPLSFLPTMIVPLVIFTHIVIFVRFARQNKQERAANLPSRPNFPMTSLRSASPDSVGSIEKSTFPINQAS